MEAASRGVRVRLLLDLGKVREGSSPQTLLETLSCRLLSGHTDGKSKMHHKFAVLDRQTALTGSYNWTMESEQDNFENLIILREAEVVEAYTREFESLWERARQDGGFAQ
jgi:mitochondrial cardiolipin hydrolase